jgi:hypothetical protein
MEISVNFFNSGYGTSSMVNDCKIIEMSVGVDGTPIAWIESPWSDSTLRCKFEERGVWRDDYEVGVTGWHCDLD